MILPQAWRLAIAPLIALATLANAGFAAAQEQGGLTLQWDAPAGCPTQDDVLKKLRAILGKSADRASRLRAQGRIEREGGSYRLTLRLYETRAGSERVIESSSCADLGGAAAVALGLLVQDEIKVQEAAGVGGRANDSGDHAGAAAAAATTANTNTNNAGAKHSNEDDDQTDTKDGSADSSSPSGEATDAARAVRFLLRAPLVGVDVGPLPRPSPTFGLALGLAVDALELTAGARLALPQTVWVDATPAYGAELQRAAFELRACYAFRSQQLAIAPCLLAAVDRLGATGVGDEVLARTSHTAVFAAGGGVHGKARFAEFLAFVVSLAGQVEMSRPEIVIEGLGQVAKVSPFAFTTSVGLEWTP